MSLFPTRLSPLVLGLMVAATTAQAMPPMLAVCDPMQPHLWVSDPEDLGNGLVARMETFFRDGATSSNWTVVTQCASGLTLAVPVEEWPESQAVKAFVRSAVASEEVMTFSTLSERLDQAFGGAFIDGSRPANVETCACQLYYGELRGDKAPFGS